MNFNDWLTEGLLPHAWLYDHPDLTAADTMFVAMSHGELLSKVKACRNALVDAGANGRMMRRFARSSNMLLDLKRRMAA